MLERVVSWSHNIFQSESTPMPEVKQNLFELLDNDEASVQRQFCLATIDSAIHNFRSGISAAC